MLISGLFNARVLTICSYLIDIWFGPMKISTFTFKEPKINRAAALTGLLSFFIASAYAEEITIDAQVWADNWFEFYVDGEVVMTDPVPVTTERSFNAEVFSFQTELPAQFAVHIMDFKEDDSGYEYIGSRRQQMGDGGFLAEFRNSEGDLVAVTDSDWTCKVIHQAPLDTSCARDTQTCQANILPMPSGWASADFDDSDWPAAVVHSARDVRPHGGYSNYSWLAETKIIWGEDLEVDNTLLCRFTLAQG